jgi:protein O-mannosyl-transferase
MTSRRITFMYLILTLIACIAFRDVRTFEFVNYDDNVYVTKNPHVCGGDFFENIIWAFTSLDTGNWHPLTWISHIVDCKVYGFDSMRHHLTSVLFHILTGLLLFHVLRKMTQDVWPSFFTAGIFLVHPMHVESVVWVAERKDVLCGFFWITAIWFYFRYSKKPTLIRYSLLFLCFAFALMSKPMAVTLPCVLILLDYWPLNRSASHLKVKNRFFGLTVEKIPLFLLSGIVSVVTYIGQRDAGALNDQTLLEKLSFSIAGYWTYLAKFFWPKDLTFLYPYPQMGWPVQSVIVAAILLIIISIFAVWRFNQQPYLLIGWLLFLGILVPVIGLIKAGGHFVVDRYSYLPYIGISIFCCWGVFSYSKARLATGVLGGITLVVFLLLAHNQTQYWKNSETLFKRAIEVTSDNYLAHNYLGGEYFARGKLAAAKEHFIAAVRINPNFADGHYNLGGVYYSQNLLDDARIEFQAAVILNPNYFMAKRYLENIRIGKALGQ